jgi:hypothetical protein
VTAAAAAPYACLYASFTPDVENSALSLRVSAYFIAIQLRAEAVNTLHIWVLLRPLIVFAMAGPALTLAALVSSRSKSPDARSPEDAAVGARLRFTSSGEGVWRIQGDRLRKSQSSTDCAPAKAEA